MTLLSLVVFFKIFYFSCLFKDYYDNSGNRDTFFKGMSSRGPPPMKRGPPVRNGGPPPKRSALSGPMGRRKCWGILLVLISILNSVRCVSNLKENVLGG